MYAVFRSRRLGQSLSRVIVFIAAGASTGVQAAVVKGTMYSPANRRNITCHVYVPPGYNPSEARRYPVVYSLHGKNGTPAQRAANYAPTLDAKIRSGAIMPMIWVFPDGQLNSYYGDAFDGHKQVYSNILEELVPVIDAKLKTYPHRDARALEGFSMGGFGAALYAAAAPELFSATLLQGAVIPIWPELVSKEPDTATEMYNNVEANWRPYSAYDATAASADAIAATVNYKQVVGDADGHMGGNLRFRDFLLAHGIDPQFQIIPGVTHAGSLYLNEGSGLAFLNDHFLESARRAGLLRVPEAAACGMLTVGALALLNDRRRKRSAL